MNSESSWFFPDMTRIHLQPTSDFADNKMIEIETADFVAKEDGYSIKSYSIELGLNENEVNLVLSRYYPIRTLGIGFDRFHLIDNDSRVPVAMNDRIINEIRKNGDVVKFPYMRFLFKIDDELRFRGNMGHLTNDDIDQVIKIIIRLYGKWKEFPNEKCFESVLEMKKIKDSLYESKKTIEKQESRIKDFRANISVIRDYISSIEKDVNRVYEDMAQSLEVLESHGYKVDLNDPLNGYDNKYEWDLGC